MTISYIIDGGLYDAPGMGADLYDGYPEVREVYAQAEKWAGLDAGRLLRWEEPRLREHRLAGAIRQAAMTLGIHDVLTARGVTPGAVAGVSLGGMIGSCIAGAIDRSDLFAVLAHLRTAPGPKGPAQGGAALVIPLEVEAERPFEAPDGVYVAVDGGPTEDGGHHLLVLSGYLDALRELAAGLPEGMVRMLPDITTAFHSPLSGHVRDYLEPCVRAIDFHDPHIPLCSCMEPELLGTADAVREMFLRNQVETVTIPYMFGNLIDQGTELAVLLGPGELDRFPTTLPFPIIQIDGADRISQGVAEIFELGGFAPLGI